MGQVLEIINKKLDHNRKVQLDIGSVVLVEYEYGGLLKTRKFTGICIRKSLKRGNIRYTLRNVISGQAVEFSFYQNWNYIIRLELLAVKKFHKIKKII